MPKPSKKAATSPPHVGDKVYPANSEMLYEISHVSHDGAEVNLHVPGTNLERFRVRTDTLTFAERKPPARTSNPFTNPETVFDAEEVLDRIDIVRRESLQRIDDDIDILKSYLKTEKVPWTAIETLEGLTIDQHKSWKAVVDRIKKLLADSGSP
jgi:hypothetical protein